ncbi:DUF7168 domain-containing protein [Snodgrassella communis]|uniref:DUF7168 domain-containing protein n=1 Tax=Snodgrassella communis TaxID=2946699 RepID=UPI001EF567B3|nr:hypothetical protein [Snodgrassella communis]
MDKVLVLDQIKKCLQEIDIRDFAATDTVLLVVQELMEKAGLFSSELIATEEVVETAFTIPKRIPDWQYSLLKLCEECFAVKSYFLMPCCLNTIKRPTWYFYGISLKPEIAAYAYKLLSKQIRTAGQAYAIQNLQHVNLPKNKVYRRNRFCFGLVSGIKGWPKDGIITINITDEESQKLNKYRSNMGLIWPFPVSEPKVEEAVYEAGNEDFGNGLFYSDRSGINRDYLL